MAKRPPAQNVARKSPKLGSNVSADATKQTLSLVTLCASFFAKQYARNDACETIQPFGLLCVRVCMHISMLCMRLCVFVCMNTSIRVRYIDSCEIHRFV
jgi:hypothetical protein